MQNLLIGVLLIGVALSQQCELEDVQKIDCGYVGIDQGKCQANGCCWKPVFNYKQDTKSKDLRDTPWCFHPKGDKTCKSINWDGSKGPGFDQDFYDKMYALFDVNINIQGKGGIVAAPDHSTPGGSYYYHWMRDAALTMRTYIELNDNNASKIEEKMKAYVGWVKKVQSEVDPNGFDIRINPKFDLPNGQVFVGGWCRPQTDGPGLRSATLVTYANILLSSGEKDYVMNSLTPLIKYDLEWIFKNWQSNGCDLWQQVRSNDFFWNRMSYYYSLDLATKFFEKIGDSDTSSQCDSVKGSVKATLDGHWTGSFMKESDNRPKDTAVIHAFSSFHGYDITDSKVAKTINFLGLVFCAVFPLNQQDDKDGIPGMLYGRYPGDSYAGGNPWQLLTAVVAKTMYQGASTMLESNGFKTTDDHEAWADLLNLPRTSSVEDMVKSAVGAGDAIMYRLYQHVKNDGGHINEQISKTDGTQVSASDLTWSFANILSAMQFRGKAIAALSTRKLVEQ